MTSLRKKLYSLIARKTIGKHTIYRYNSRYKRQDVYPYVTPANPNTEKQQENRMKFRDGMAAWNALQEEEKALYEVKAKALKIAGKNLFMREWMKT